MNKRKDPYDYGSRLTQETTDRVCELERELVEEKNRPVIAAILMTLLVLVLLVLGLIAYSIVGGGKPTAAGEVLSSQGAARLGLLVGKS